jgi:regulator of protease activity HflC (stomatin/prohibitin superfamily)
MEAGPVLVAVLVLVTMAKSIRVVPAAHARLVERLGRYHRTLEPGIATVVPFVDRVLPPVLLRERTVSLRSHQVMTRDDHELHLQAVIYYQVIDAKAATYEIADPDQGVEQIAVIALRDVISDMDLDVALNSRNEINYEVRRMSDAATSTWGVRINRVDVRRAESPVAPESDHLPRA